LPFPAALRQQAGAAETLPENPAPAADLPEGEPS
jgi:hypothetical protein